MPSLAEDPRLTYVKMLLLGDSGTGKTGALASLVNDLGKKLLILDFDDQLQILADKIRPELRHNVFYETLVDKVVHIGDGKVSGKGTPKAFSRGLDILTTGKIKDGAGGQTMIGDISSLGPDWVVVIDSLTLASQAALRFVRTSMAAKDGRMDYFNAQQRIIGLLTVLKGIDTNVVVIAHIDYVDDLESMTLNDKGEAAYEQKGRPRSVGKAIAPEIPSYFNTMVRAKTKGSGAALKRVIRTVSEGIVDLKTSAPSKVKVELDLSTGLAELFRVLTAGAATPAVPVATGVNLT